MKKVSKTTKTPTQNNSLLDTSKDIFGENHFISLLIALLLNIDIDKKEVLQPATKDISKALKDRIPKDLSPLISGDLSQLISTNFYSSFLNNFSQILATDPATRDKFFARLLDLFIERLPAMTILYYSEDLIKHFIQFPESQKILAEMLAKQKPQKKETFNLDEIIKDKSVENLENLLDSANIHIAGLFEQFAALDEKKAAQKEFLDRFLKALRVFCALLALRELFLIEKGILADKKYVWRNSLKLGALLAVGFGMTEAFLRPEILNMIFSFVAATFIKTRRWGPQKDLEKELKDVAVGLGRETWQRKPDEWHWQVAKWVYPEILKTKADLIHDLKNIVVGELAEPIDEDKKGKKERKFEKYIRGIIRDALAAERPERVGGIRGITKSIPADP